jgi:hypothetical protein
MHNFHTHINTFTGAILIRISTRKPSNIFSKKKTYRRLATQELKSLPKHETMLELAFARRFTISTLPLYHIGAWLPGILARTSTTLPSRVKSKYTFNAHFCTKRKVIRF